MDLWYWVWKPLVCHLSGLTPPETNTQLQTSRNDAKRLCELNLVNLCQKFLVQLPTEEERADKKPATPNVRDDADHQLHQVANLWLYLLQTLVGFHACLTETRRASCHSLEMFGTPSRLRVAKGSPNQRTGSALGCKLLWNTSNGQHQVCELDFALWRVAKLELAQDVLWWLDNRDCLHLSQSSCRSQDQCLLKSLSFLSDPNCLRIPRKKQTTPEGLKSVFDCTATQPLFPEHTQGGNGIGALQGKCCCSSAAHTRHTASWA